MGAPIFCNLCSSLGGSDDGSFLSNTEEAKKKHAKIHLNQSKFLDDPTLSEEEVLRQCFKSGHPSERSIPSQIECRQLLHDICKSLEQELQSNKSKIVCNMCGFEICRRKGRTFSMFRHACAHLEDKLLQCRHCDLSSSNPAQLLHHIRHVHKIEPIIGKDFEDTIIEHFDEISDRIKRCFSTSYPRLSGRQCQFVIRSNCRDKSQRPASNLCRSIYIQRSEPASLDCNLCGLQISLRERHGRRTFKASAMYQHAAAHLAVKLYSCRHCNQTTSSKLAMGTHLRRSHQIMNRTSSDYADHSKELNSARLNTIERCFSAEQVKLEEPSKKDKSMIRSEANVRNGGSKLAVERRLFCNRLIRKTVDSDGKIKCSVCAKRTVVNHSGSTRLLRHVGRHLKKPLYRCKVCGSSFDTQSIIAHHLRTTHALGMAKNHECIADEFHAKIMAMLTKCYATHGL